MLKLQGKELTEDTTKAIGQISKFLATLSIFYHKNEVRPIFDDDVNNI